MQTNSLLGRQQLRPAYKDARLACKVHKHHDNEQYHHLNLVHIHGTQLLVALINNLLGYVSIILAHLHLLSLLALGTPQTHEMPLQENICEQRVDQHRRHRIEHECREIHFLCSIRKSRVVDTLKC